MKNVDTTTILLKALDIELRSLLTNDLQQYKAKKLTERLTPTAIKKAA